MVNSVPSYKNGSQTREMIRDSCASGSWEVSHMTVTWLTNELNRLVVFFLQEFNKLLEKTAPGNNGNIGV